MVVYSFKSPFTGRRIPHGGGRGGAIETLLRGHPSGLYWDAVMRLVILNGHSVIG